MEDKYLKLTNAVYKMLEFFPESDPLKNRAKDKALAIMSALSEAAPHGEPRYIGRDIDLLLGYLWIGKEQGWISSINFLIVSNEYDKIKNEKALPASRQAIAGFEQNLPEPRQVFKKSNAAPKEPHLPKAHEVTARQGPLTARQGPLTARQGKILDFLISHEKAQVMDLKTVLPDVTKRTIRRDLDYLLQIGKIERMGEFSSVVYKIKGVGHDRTEQL